MPHSIDLLLLLESASRLKLHLPPELLFIQAGGLDSAEPPELSQFRLHNAWLNSWPLLSDDSRQCLASAVGVPGPQELLAQITNQAVSLALGRLRRTYGDSAKVDGLHRQAVQGGKAQ